MTTLTLDEFIASLDHGNLPDDIPPALKALWAEATGDWDTAHHLVQDDHGDDAAWVHAYLHRKEGDRGNAGYWYTRAGKSMSEESFEEEWRHIAATLLEEQ